MYGKYNIYSSIYSKIIIEVYQLTENAKEKKEMDNNYIVKGQICFTDIDYEATDFCFNVPDWHKEQVSLAVSAYNNDDIDKDEDVAIACSNIDRSAIAAFCCKNPYRIPELFENILSNTTDYDVHELDVGEYLSASVNSEDEDEYANYEYIEIESLANYWEQYCDAITKYCKEPTSPEFLSILEMVGTVLYNCGYCITDPEDKCFIIKNLSMVDDGSVKPLSNYIPE